MNWKSETSYKVGDIVIYEGVTYRCLFEHVSHLAWAPSIYTQSVWNSISSEPTAPIPTPVTPPVTTPAPISTPPEHTGPVKKSRNLNELLNGKRPIGAYFESWAMNWTSSTNNTLTNIKHANIIYLSFVSPDCTYKRGQNSWNGTGLSFSSDFQVIKDSIATLQKRGVIVMLSVGGATYPFSANYNADGAANLVKDLNLNGIDIDWENHEQKANFGKYIAETRRALGDEFAISAATFSVGAYGEGAFANAQPPSAYTGMSIPGLKSNGHQLDWLNLMTYDAGNTYDPLQAYDAHKAIFKGPLLIGAQTPPEAWGGHVITLDKVKQYVNHVKKDTSNIGGLFVWAYFKQGTPNCNDILNTAIETFGPLLPTPTVPAIPVPPPQTPSPTVPTVPTSVVGKTVLGFQFFQDTKSGWARIDNVTIGESEKYSYNTFDGPVIDQVLDSAFENNEVVAVLYEWATGKAYAKTGFNLDIVSDSKSNPGFTTFVVKNRVTPLMIAAPVQPAVTQPAVTQLAVTQPPKKLVGKDVLGSVIIQDDKPNWLKLGGVTVGDTFNYQSYNSPDIGGLLDQVSGDPNVAVLLYNWKTGDAYSKTGFNFDNGDDTKINADFTSFIVKDFKAPVIDTSTSNFVRWQNGNFTLEGAKFVPVGLNCYWLGYTEWHNYPTKAQIEEIFIVASKMKATVVRSHTLGSSNGHPKSLTPTSSTGFNDAAWDPIDYSFSMAKKYGIKLIIPLCDVYEYFHGSYGFFTKNRGVDKTKFWSDRNVINDFKAYITIYLNHVNPYTGVAIKNAPEVCMIELGNELGNIRPTAGSTSIPTESWTREISQHIKSIDKTHLVLDGCDEALSKSGSFNVREIDVYTGHFYWLEKDRIEYGANTSANLGKPYIIGEYSSKFGPDWYSYIESRNNIKGSIMWCIYCHEGGYRSGAKIPHNDSFTLHYPEDNDKLLCLTNHFRKMRGMSTVNSLEL